MAKPRLGSNILISFVKKYIIYIILVQSIKTSTLTFLPQANSDFINIMTSFITLVSLKILQILSDLGKRVIGFDF